MYPEVKSIKNNLNIQISISHFTFRDKFRLSLIQFYNLYAVLRVQDMDCEDIRSFYFFLSISSALFE